MRKELKDKAVEENKYHALLGSNPQYILEGYSMKSKKVVVGIIQGNPENYNQGTDTLDFKYFDTWQDAYMQLTDKSYFYEKAHTGIKSKSLK